MKPGILIQIEYSIETSIFNNNFIIKNGIKIIENENKQNPIAERNDRGFIFLTSFIAF